MDTNILSTFARVGELGLLFALFPRSLLGVTSGILGEVHQAVAQGCEWLTPVLVLRTEGRLQLAESAPEEQRIAQALPSSLGSGERDFRKVKPAGRKAIP